LCNNPTNGVIPSNVLPHKNSLTKSGEAWHFTYAGPDCRIVYTYEPLTGTLDDFTVQVDNRPVIRPALGSGATTVLVSSNSKRHSLLSGGKPLAISRAGNSLCVTWEYPPTNGPVRLDWRFTIIGKALAINAAVSNP